MKQVTVRIGTAAYSCEAGTKISELSLFPLPCGGHGKCGKCKVIARGELSPLSDTERNKLTPDEIAAGVRLACCTKLLGDAELSPFFAERGNEVLTGGRLSLSAIDPAYRSLGVAIDVGTTTLAAKLFSETGDVLAEDGRLNPNATFGADVISRIESALAGKGTPIAEELCGALDDMIRTMTASAGRRADEVDALVITGNTAMLHLLTKTSPEPLSHAPFAVARRFGETLSAGEIGLFSILSETPVYLPPCISAFVGADTVCALLAAGLPDSSETEMLADIGTNGEMALVKDGKLTVCSTAAGPAFEGVGISMGMRGAVGAIDRVTLENGRLCAHTIGGNTPVGICGSGLVDAIACLLEGGILDETGFLEDDPITVAPPVTLTGGDVRAVQLAKSAICSGMETLLHEAGLDAKEVRALAVAGGFGQYLKPENAARIGLLPEGLVSVLRTVGNAALDGAALLLLDRTAREKAQKIADSALTLELSNDPFFGQAFIDNMLFPEP